MPVDPLRLLRLQMGLPPDPQPVEATDIHGPTTIGGDQPLDMTVPPEAPSIEMPDDFVGTIEMPDDYVRRRPKVQVTLGEPTVEPWVDSTPEETGSPSDEPGASQTSPPPIPPVDPDLAGSPAYQRAQASAAGPADEVPPAQAEEPLQPLTEEQRTLYLNDQIERALRPPVLNTMDEAGNPQAALSPEDIIFKGMVQSDQSLLMQLDGIRLNGSVEAEQARRSAPSMARYTADVERISRRSDDEIQRMLAEVKRGYDEARDAARAADAAYPNPDDLLGGRGSWTRALSLGLSAAYAGVPGSSIASVIDQQLKLQQASQASRYERLKARAGTLGELADRQAGSIKDVAGGYQAMTIAARERLAARLQEIANGLAEPKARLNMLNAASALYERSAKDKYDLGKTLAEVRLKEAEATEKYALAQKAGRVGGVGSGNLSKTGYFDPNSGTWVPFPPGVNPTGPQREDIRKAGEHYANYRNGLRRLKALVDEVKRQSLAGTVSEKWKTAKQREYTTIATMMAYEQAKMADPSSTVREGEFKEFSKILPMPSTLFGNEYDAAEAIYDALTEVADSKYSTGMRSYGIDPAKVVAETASREQVDSGPPNSIDLGKSVSPDFVPGHKPDIGPESDVVKGWDAYVQNFYDNRIGGTDAELVAELTKFVEKSRESLRKAEVAVAKAHQKDLPEAIGVRNRWRTIVTDQEQRLKDVMDGASRREHDRQHKKNKDAAAAAMAAKPQPRR